MENSLFLEEWSGMMNQWKRQQMVVIVYYGLVLAENIAESKIEGYFVYNLLFPPVVAESNPRTE